MANKELADRLKELRQKRGWSKDELAKKANIEESAINNMELGRRRIYASDLKALSDAFGINMNDFFEVEKILDLQQTKLVEIYQKLNEPSKKILMRTAEDLFELEKNQTTLIMPYLFAGHIPTTELDYYPQAAGMGGGQYVTDAFPEKINVPSFEVPPKADFIIQVVGDSMEPSFKTGDKLFIESTSVLNLGDIGVFNYLGEQLVKEFGKGELISHNKSYEPIRVNEKDLYIQGRVLGKV